MKVPAQQRSDERSMELDVLRQLVVLMEYDTEHRNGAKCTPEDKAEALAWGFAMYTRIGRVAVDEWLRFLRRVC